MRKALHKIFKLYSHVIINFNGIFIFVGVLAVVFGDYGWFPNKDIYAISQFVYQCVIPILIAYALGNCMQGARDGKESERLRFGGAIAVMATAGMVMAERGSGIFGAMFLGPCCSLLWERLILPLLERVKSGMEMLLRNVVVALTGAVLAVFSFYILAPALSAIVGVVFIGTDYLINHNLVFLLNILIEPAKVFFLNNVINHGIMVPLGLQQVNEHGSSILFLLESNPGPGLGVLLALYLMKVKKRKQYASSMFTQFVGGVHEVYFPEVLSNPWLIAALMGGGVTGTLCFSLMRAAALAPVSPGSILTMMMVTERDSFFAVLLGVVLSAGVSLILGLLILRWREDGNAEREGVAVIDHPKQESIEKQSSPVRKVGIICDGGVGSSAMGAALFRRKLKEMNVIGIEVNAYAGDQVPSELDMGICQKDFRKMTGFELEGAPLYEVESLMNQAEYEPMIEEIKKRNGENI
ncbi:MAG: hypothetical protein PHW34_05930 [Hespellia sp.]|nr:hypothetical protein [Hespellia sp.]